MLAGPLRKHLIYQRCYVVCSLTLRRLCSFPLCTMLALGVWIALAVQGRAGARA